MYLLPSCLRYDLDGSVNMQPANSIPDLVTKDMEAFANTETIVPPFKDPIMPPFPRHQYFSHGTNTLLLIPTQNKFKTKLLQEAFKNSLPEGQTLHILSIAFDSGVGEQPYNEAGLRGAWNRINNALNFLDDPHNQGVLKEKTIGTVIIASIENYIQIADVSRPTDYGVIVTHNATTNKTVATLSEGVTVPTQYLEKARDLGFEDDEKNCGKVTVGEVFASEVNGIDKANWHEATAGKSRYSILSEAVSKIEIQW